MVKNLPVPAQKRIKALKNLQLEFLRHECLFFEEVYQLERKYQEKYQSITDKRKEIIAGEYEPAGAEAEFKSDDEEEDEDEAEMQARLKTMKALPQYDENVKGKFWITHVVNICLNDSFPFRNSGLLAHNFP